MLFRRRQSSPAIVDRYLAGDQAATALIEPMLADGATLEDVTQWFAMSGDAVEGLEREDNAARAAMFDVLIARGLDHEQAVEEAIRAVAFCDTGDTHPSLRGEDRPLPWPLKKRVLAWTLERTTRDAAAFKAERAEFSSWNAFIRAEVRAGRL